MTAFSGNNIVLVKNGITVTIGTTPDDEENLTKSLFLITPPKSGNQQSSDPTDPDYGPNSTKIVDILMKCEQRITINGYLVNALGDSDSHTDAQSKKSDLKKVFLGGGTATMTYEGSSITVGLEKLSITRVNTEGLAASSGEAEFSIKMTCVKGEDFG